MKTRPNKFSSVSGRQIPGLASEPRSHVRGVALIITLILLLLLSAASLAIVLLVSSDTMINGFYRNYRGSFYAADSGVNVAVEAMRSAVLSAGNGAGNPPFSSGTPPTSVTSSYAPYQSGYYTFGDANSWNGKFIMVANPGGTPVIGAAVPSSQSNPADPTNPNDLLWTYTYPYTITVKGVSSGTEGEEITETGSITYSSAPGSAAIGAAPNFSKWAAFITNFAACQGPLVPGTMTGPFFTDGQWNFGNFSNPGYTFTGSIGQNAALASWIKYNRSGSQVCTGSATAPSGFKKPSFPSGGLQVSQTYVQPPTDSYNQLQAVLDGQGTTSCSGSTCQTLMNQELQTVNGTQPPATGAVPNGVYIPSHTSGTGPGGQACPCFGSGGSPGGYAGGFYIQGDASVTLTATTAGNGSNLHNTQTYTIVQSGTTTTIVVDNTLGATTVTSGSASETLTGVPAQPGVTNNDPSGTPVNPTLIYVNGAITGLTGTYDSSNNPLAAVQDNTGVTVVATGNVSITGDLTYTQPPVSIPGDTLNTATNAGVLGIYTNQNINLYPDPNGNLTVEASLAAIGGASGTSGFETPNGSSISNWTIVGGRSEDQAHGVNIGSGNTYYDQRFGGNFGPPWFPTAVPQAGTSAVPATPPTVTVTRSTWAEVNRQ